jgi:hypothetical protein
MPYIDILLLIIASLTCFFASFILFKIGFHSPLSILYILLSLSIFAFGLNFVFILPILAIELNFNFASTLNYIDAMNMLKISHFFGILFIFTFTILSYLPSLTLNIKDIIILIFLSIFNTLAFIINFFTMKYTYSKETEKISIIYNIYGEITILCILVLLVYVFILRYKEMLGVLKRSQFGNSNKFNNHLNSRNKLYFFIFLIILSFIFGRTIDFLPSYLWAGFSSIGIFYLIYSIKKNKEFYFITNSRLEGILVLNTLSGKIQYFKNYQNVDMLLTSVMTAFNLSIKQMVQSTTDIKQIVLEDKTLLLSRGEFITVILQITSKRTIISDAILKFLTDRFEKIFLVILKQYPYGADDLRSFQIFEIEINKINDFFSF